MVCYWFIDSFTPHINIIHFSMPFMNFFWIVLNCITAVECWSGVTVFILRACCITPIFNGQFGRPYALWMLQSPLI